MPIEIIKTGTIDADIVEATPIVWRDQLYRFEYIRPRYWNNRSRQAYFRFVHVESGACTPPFGHGLHLGSALVWDGKVYVFAVNAWGGDTLLLLASEDLQRWSEPVVLWRDLEMKAYNTSVCRTESGFVMAYELGEPSRYVGEPFTIFFAESEDLHHWRRCDELPSYLPDRYTACPTLRHVDGYFYMFVLEGSYNHEFYETLVRSRDLRQWQAARGIVLRQDERDRIGAERFPAAATVRNINNSDVDLCEYRGRTVFCYAWGDQRGTEFLAGGYADCPLATFLQSWF